MESDRSIDDLSPAEWDMLDRQQEKSLVEQVKDIAYSGAEVGKKYDTGKAPLSMLPGKSLNAIAQVMAFGAQKYGRDNWQHLEDFENRYMDAALRHLFAHCSGEELDPESGLPHVAHAGTNLLFLLHGGGK